MDLLRQIKIQDATLSTLTAGVNTSNELKVNDASLATLQTTTNTKLTDIETAVESSDANNRSNRILLEQLLEQAKLTNMYLAYISKVEFKEQDI